MLAKPNGWHNMSFFLDKKLFFNSTWRTKYAARKCLSNSWLLSSLFSCCAIPQSVNRFLPPLCLDAIYMPLPRSTFQNILFVFLFHNGPDLELCYSCSDATKLITICHRDQSLFFLVYFIVWRSELKGTGGTMVSNGNNLVVWYGTEWLPYPYLIVFTL